MEQNHNLIYGFAHKRKLDLEDWYGILAIELCKSVKGWDKDRGSLSTYFYMRAESIVKKEYRKKNTHKRKANENPSEIQLDTEGEEDSENEKLILKDMLKYGHEEIIMLRYEGYNQYEIAEKLDIQQPTISRILNKVLDEYLEESECYY